MDILHPPTPETLSPELQLHLQRCTALLLKAGAAKALIEDEKFTRDYRNDTLNSDQTADEGVLLMLKEALGLDEEAVARMRLIHEQTTAPEFVAKLAEEEEQVYGAELPLGVVRLEDEVSGSYDLRICKVNQDGTILHNRTVTIALYNPDDTIDTVMVGKLESTAAAFDFIGLVETVRNIADYQQAVLGWQPVLTD